MYGRMRQLEQHIQQCTERHTDTIKRIEDLSAQTRGEFELVRKERERTRQEMLDQFGRIYGGIWKAVGIVGGAILASYLASHGVWTLPH